MTFVPSLRRSGTRVIVPAACDVEQRRRPSQVGVGDEDVFEARSGDGRDTVVDGTIQAEPGTPDDLRALRSRPLGDRVVVAGNVRGDLGHHLEHPRRHPLGEPRPIAVDEHAGQAALRRRESLDRDQHGETH